MQSLSLDTCNVWPVVKGLYFRKSCHLGIYIMILLSVLSTVLLTALSPWSQGSGKEPEVERIDLAEKALSRAKSQSAARKRLNLRAQHRSSSRSKKAKDQGHEQCENWFDRSWWGQCYTRMPCVVLVWQLGTATLQFAPQTASDTEKLPQNWTKKKFVKAPCISVWQICKEMES